MHRLAALAALLAAAPAFADEVTLRNGRVVTGMSREEGDRIVVELPFGTVAYSRDEVVAIALGETPLHAYAAKAVAVKDSRDLRDWTDLLAFARENKLPRYVGGLCAKILDLDPDNDAARRELGHVRIDGAWRTPAEMDARAGKVLFEGRWLLPLEIELIRAKRLDAAEREFRSDAKPLPFRVHAVQDPPPAPEPRVPQDPPARRPAPRPAAREIEGDRDLGPVIEEPQARPLGIPGASLDIPVRRLGFESPAPRPRRAVRRVSRSFDGEEFFNYYYLGRILGWEAWGLPGAMPGCGGAPPPARITTVPGP